MSKIDKSPFYQSELISPNSFVFITKVKYQGIFRRQIKKVDWKGSEKNSYLPDKQIDGYFCTDGLFSFDRKLNLLVYMFYYRGKFTCLDSNLNVLYHANTIDTAKHANLQLKTIPNRFNPKLNDVTQSKPPSVVNRRLFTTNGKIYIQSYLKADNEDNNEFKNSEVIDVYNSKNGKYYASFYLPKIERQKLTEFKIYRNKLIALFKNNLVIFKIPRS